MRFLDEEHESVAYETQPKLIFLKCFSRRALDSEMSLLNVKI